MTEPIKPITRRDFLKVAGAATGAAILTKVGLDKLSSDEREGKPEFSEVAWGRSLMLRINGGSTPSEVVIFYAGGEKQMASIWQRESGSDWVILPFNEGAKTIRRMGEISSDSLVKVKKSSQWPEGKPLKLHMSTSALGVTDTDIDFPEGKDVYALPVITAWQDLGEDGKAPYENNANPSTLPKRFGDGMAICKYFVENNVGKLSVIGYLSDATAAEKADE